MAPKTLNIIAILSQKRQEPVSYFNVCLLGELNNFPREIMTKIDALVFYLIICNRSLHNRLLDDSTHAFEVAS